MRLIIFFFLVILLSNCSKPKTVLICGDHVCVNQQEAEQYFEENLTIEVKVIRKNKKKDIDLVELNLNQNKSDKKEINIFTKKITGKNLKILSKQEKNQILKNIKEKQKEKKIVKEKIVKKTKLERKKTKLRKNVKENLKMKEFNKNNIDEKRQKVVDICTILEKCNIEEISKYLLNQGKKRKFPDITQRQ